MSKFKGADYGELLEEFGIADDELVKFSIREVFIGNHKGVNVLREWLRAHSKYATEHDIIDDGLQPKIALLIADHDDDYAVVEWASALIDRFWC